MARLRKRTEETWLRGLNLEAPSQGQSKKSGVVLRRKITPEGDMSLLLFLKDSGLLWASLPGASRGSVRFGGATEPLVWGSFIIHQSPTNAYVKEIEVFEDSWAIRNAPASLHTVITWTTLMTKHLMFGYPYNDLLGLFYWASKALSNGANPQLVSLRFIWKWLNFWGIAPSLSHCHRCGRPINQAWADSHGNLWCSSCNQDIPKEAFLDNFPKFSDYVNQEKFQPIHITEEEAKQLSKLWPLLAKGLELQH